MRRKLQTTAGRAIYARREVIVEPGFGQIRQRQGLLHAIAFADMSRKARQAG